MSIKPILFNTEMVWAILDGRKTVTRRPVKFLNNRNPNWTGYIKDGLMLYNGKNEPCCKRPPYQPGDILYVREKFRLIDFQYIDGDWSASIEYFADNDIGKRLHNLSPNEKINWKPSIHMPKEAARIWLKVTDVRMERIKNITEDEAHREGFKSREDFISSILKMYPDCTEDSWIWVIEFERTVKPEC